MKSSEIVKHLKAERQTHVAAIDRIDIALSALQGYSWSSRDAAGSTKPATKPTRTRRRAPSVITATIIALLKNNGVAYSRDSLVQDAHHEILNVHQLRIPLRKVRKALSNLQYQGRVTRTGDLITLNQKES